jgi:hypothetical protein
MTIPLRTLDELHSAPHMATLPALSASMMAFSAALEIAHPALLVLEPRRPRDTAALLLRMYLDACHELLRDYDRLTFDEYEWSDCTEECPDDETEPDDDEAEPDDDIPF